MNSIAVGPVCARIRLFKESITLTFTYRLRGASYRVYGAAHHPKSQRWRRHLLVMLSPNSGVFPLPLVFWLGYPDSTVYCYTLGVVRAYLLSKLKAKAVSFSWKSIVCGKDAGLMFDLVAMKEWMSLWRNIQCERKRGLVHLYML